MALAPYGFKLCLVEKKWKGREKKKRILINLYKRNLQGVTACLDERKLGEKKIKKTEFGWKKKAHI